MKAYCINNREVKGRNMYGYDAQLSIQLAKNHSDLFEMRACYNNVYNMVSHHLEELTPWDKLRILFCYRKGNGEQYYRHAFCLFDGKLVEPLLYLDMSDYNRRSIVPIREMTVTEYLDLLCKEAETQLRTVLREDDLSAVRKHKLNINPYDYSKLMQSTIQRRNEQ